MNSDSSGGHIIDLRSHAGFHPDLAALARQQLIAAREHLELEHEAFAAVLATVLGWTPSPEMIESWEESVTPPGDVLVAAGMVSRVTASASETGNDDLVAQLIGNRFVDVTAIYATRSEFAAHMPVQSIFDDALDIRAAGLSLNMICQQYPDDQLARLIVNGATLRCLFLDPNGGAIREREREEGYPPGALSTLTALNIEILQRRVRDRLPPDRRDALMVSTLDETVRFNITIVDHQLMVMQPYLRDSRGIDSPTFIIHKRLTRAGLFPVFEQMFASMWQQGRPV